MEDEHIREAALMLENIVCAACVWLNERHIAALPGVLSAILKAVADIGYLAHPFDPAHSDDMHKRERKYRDQAAGGGGPGVAAR